VEPERSSREARRPPGAAPLLAAPGTLLAALDSVSDST